MGVLNREAGEIHAKIVFYGPTSSGKTANAEFIYRKLKKDHRGELRVEQTRGEPQAAYEFLPVQLGKVRGYETSIHLHTVPGADVHADERRQILDGVDGVLFVADLRPDRHESTLASLDELERHLQSYGRSLSDVILIAQYNHRDEADENALEALHARMNIKPAATFEATASEGTGVLQCLTTISKLMLAKIRAEAEEMEARAAEIAAEPEPVAESGEELEPLAQVASEEIIVEPCSPEDAGFSLETAGPVEQSDAELRIPIRLVEGGSGRKIELSLRLTLDA
jgi:signal recognition particle receptor subunit beta